MKFKRFLLPVIVIISLLIQLAVPVCAAGVPDIIRQLLLYYTYYQEDARTDILRLLEEMRGIDPEQADNWQQIMDCWHWACTELEVTPDVLPDGLPEDDSLCIVVMGFALNYNGTIREELLGRLRTTLASAEKYPNAYILCTGGGTAGGNRNVTEAGQMAAWLEDAGIDPGRIIVEDRSYSTELNAQYSMEILRESYPQVTSLALISSDYHLRRCHWLFQSMIYLSDLEESCAVVANAGYEAGYVGESGFWAEAESMGNLFKLRVRFAAAPELSTLTEISVSGNTEYLSGQAPELIVTAHYDTGFQRNVTEQAEFTPIDPDSPGTQELSVSYTENGITASSAMTITILPPPTEATQPPTEEATQSTSEETSLATAPTELTQEAPPASLSPMVFIGVAVVVISAILCLVHRKKPKGKYEKRG